ncbi:MAG: DUF167 domain-containing protein [Deltaproteobacteria bacterium]|nr:DUF167 domain-containing protein [Deltaproteobacteria bacterium]
MSTRRTKVEGAEPPGASAAALRVTPRQDGARLAVHVKPRASRSMILGVREGALAVAVRAPPERGEANAELVRLLAEALGIRRAAVAVVAGAGARTKLVDAIGVGPDEVRARLGEVLCRARR